MNNKIKEYLIILEITDIENVTKEVVRKAFLKKAKKVHPDHNNSTEANDEFKKLYEAYQVILKYLESKNDSPNNYCKEELPKDNHSSFMFFDKDMYYWLTKIFGKVMPSFIQQGYEPTGIFGPPYK